MPVSSKVRKFNELSGYPYIETTHPDWNGIPDFSFEFDPAKKHQLTTNGHILNHLPPTKWTWVYGGASAGKTHHILRMLTDRNLERTERGIRWRTQFVNQYKQLVTEESQPKFFDYIRHDLGMPVNKYTWTGGSESRGRWKYLIPGSDSWIRFSLVGKPETAKGMRPNDLYFNEVTQMIPAAIEQFGRRSGRIWLDANPDIPTLYNYLRDTGRLGDYTFVRLNYTGNEMCSNTDRANFEVMRRTDYAQYLIYGLGHFGAVDRIIYRHIKPIDRIPDYAHLIGRGLDWGFGDGDPMAMIALWRVVVPLGNNQNAAIYIIDQEIYGKEMDENSVAEFLYRQPYPHAPIVADNSGKRSIAMLRQKGFNVIASEARNDNVVEGINYVKARVVRYTRKSIDFERELQSYAWGRDINDAPTNKPQLRAEDHLMDAMRYAMVKLEHYPPVNPGPIFATDRPRRPHPLAAFN